MPTRTPTFVSLRLFILTGLLMALLVACGEEKEAKKMVLYKGPLSEVNNLDMLFSDSAKVRIHLKAPLQLELENGDRTFPKGVFIEFYDEKGVKTSTLKANKGIRYANNIYYVQGNVIVHNLEKNETLNTEELNWKPDTKKIYTDKFVTIKTPESVLKGTGLDAEQDFSRYHIRQPTGILPLEQ